MWLSLTWFILGFFCLLILILYNSKPQNTFDSVVCYCTKMFLFCFTKILNQAFLHDSVIWIWGFFTLLVALAHGVAGGLLRHTHNFWQPTFNINFHWRVGEFRHYVKFSGCKIRFYDATKKFYKPADWMSPSLAYTYSCIKVHSIYR